MKTIAIILAGGAGKRLGGNKPKQFLPLQDGLTVLEHAVAAFQDCNCIDEVMVVMHKDWQDEAQALLPGVKLVVGGRERWESSWNALQQITGEANVLIHDAARPFVSQRIIEDVCCALEKHEAVTVGVAATDTMYEVADGLLRQIPKRSTMMRAQTPQGFRLSVIKKAYEIAIKDPELQVTDDCGIVHKYLPEMPIYIVEGEEANRKITFREDL